MKGKNRIYTKEGIEKAVKESISVADVCRKLGIQNPKGGSYQLIQNRIREYDFDTSHFLGKYAFAGKRGANYQNRTPKENVLIDGCMYRRSHKILKRALIEYGVNYICSVCNITEWMGKELTLDIDHINGNWSDCKKENLRFICPNCHRQTKTFGAKNKKAK